MDAVKAFFKEKDRFARHCGIELEEVGEGSAVASMQVDERHLNGVDMTHGGALFTLADFAFAAACNSHGTVAVAISATISFVKAGRVGETLKASAKEASRNPKLGLYEIEIRNESAELLAKFQGMAYRKKESLLPEN